jgi:hypothetical protein
MKHTRPSSFYAACFLGVAFFLYNFLPLDNPYITAQTGSIDSSARSETPVPARSLFQTGSEIVQAPFFTLSRRASFPNTLPPAATSEAPDPLLSFIASVLNGMADLVTGVYVPDLFALPVIQQPEKQPTYVSEQNGLVTQFSSAAKNGVTGLLGHNYLSGELFYKLEIGHEVLIVYGDGAVQHYQVISIDRFQKLTPSSLRSNLVDQDSGETKTTPQVFDQFYRGEHRVTFQTCLEKDGNLNWGLVFIVAVPLE